MIYSIILSINKGDIYKEFISVVYIPISIQLRLFTINLVLIFK